MDFQNSLDHARSLDAADPLKDFRSQFHFPLFEGQQCIYFTGHSLGLQPKKVREAISEELSVWANLAVEGHFHAKTPWINYHDYFPQPLSDIVGCLPEEVVVMNHLTVNLHLLMLSFYRPTSKRYKIICEAKSFPSDQYALQSQTGFHGLDMNDTIIEVAPRDDEHTIRLEDILSVIDQYKDQLALVLFGGINYYTGQFFDIKAITEAAHKSGAYAGFDLAHAAGNVKLSLHEWEVDFACWCSYKYLNSGPGGIAGAFIHKKHLNRQPRLAGWWGNIKETRFLMEKDYRPIPSAEGWQISNSPVILMAMHKAALDIFREAGMERLLQKSRLLTGYLIYVLELLNDSVEEKVIEIITPKAENERGCQISILMLKGGGEIHKGLKQRGVIVDWREPNVIRVAPVPLYNSFEDVWRFGKIIEDQYQKKFS